MQTCNEGREADMGCGMRDRGERHWGTWVVERKGIVDNDRAKGTRRQ